MNPKALLFDKFLKDEEITSFERKDFDDEDGTVVYRSYIKSPLWDMPLFIGVSKTSRHRKSLYATLTKMLSNKQYEQEMKQHLIETIQRIERENAGVVPPAFVKK